MDGCLSSLREWRLLRATVRGSGGYRRHVTVHSLAASIYSPRSRGVCWACGDSVGYVRMLQTSFIVIDKHSEKERYLQFSFHSWVGDMMGLFFFDEDLI